MMWLSNFLCAHRFVRSIFYALMNFLCVCAFIEMLAIFSSVAFLLSRYPIHMYWAIKSEWKIWKPNKHEKLLLALILCELRCLSEITFIGKRGYMGKICLLFECALAVHSIYVRAPNPLLYQSLDIYVSLEYIKSLYYCLLAHQSGLLCESKCLAFLSVVYLYFPR